MEGSLSEGTQQNYWEKFSVSTFLSLKPRSPAPPSRPAEDPLLADDTGGILGEPCGVSDLIVLLQAQGLGDCWCCGGRPWAGEEPSRAGTAPSQGLPDATPESVGRSHSPSVILDGPRFRDPVTWCS